MRNIPEQYHETLRSRNLIPQCLEKARERFPGQRLDFCGFEKNWEDCLGNCLPNQEGTALSLLFYFNVDGFTHAITESVPLS